MKSKIDWQAVEREYRAALLSNRELAGKYSCSEASVRKQAKIQGWQRDLSAMIRKRVANKIAQAPARKVVKVEPEPDTTAKAELQEAIDERIVEDASNAITEIIAQHHEILGTTRTRIERVFGGIDLILNAMDSCEDAEEKEVKLKTSARLLDTHTKTLERILKLERVSFGIDESDEQGGKRRTLADLMKTVLDDQG